MAPCSIEVPRNSCPDSCRKNWTNWWRIVRENHCETFDITYILIDYWSGYDIFSGAKLSSLALVIFSSCPLRTPVLSSPFSALTSHPISPIYSLLTGTVGVRWQINTVVQSPNPSIFRLAAELVHLPFKELLESESKPPMAKLSGNTAILSRWEINRTCLGGNVECHAQKICVIIKSRYELLIWSSLTLFHVISLVYDYSYHTRDIQQTRRQVMNMIVNDWGTEGGGGGERETHVTQWRKRPCKCPSD